MTFIASVIAKEGVAIIADSLVTSVRPVIESDDFFKYLNEKAAQSGDSITVEPSEIIALFKVKPSHTKDYEDKLYKYGKYSAITTAGNASINGTRIKTLVDKAIKTIKPNDRSDQASILIKVEQLKEFILIEVKKFLSKNKSIDTTILLFTSYSRILNKSFVYKITVNPARDEDLKNVEFEFVSSAIQSENMTVICEGQNKLSERLLLGDFSVIFEKLPSIVKKVAIDFNIPEEQITDEYLFSLLNDSSIMTKESINDIKMLKLRDLSLQQAVDLANLLMRIEIDIQKYTENIPSVGGVIKLAVIDSAGFRFISGHEIVKHESF
jgi:hypothetical protein